MAAAGEVLCESQKLCLVCIFLYGSAPCPSPLKKLQKEEKPGRTNKTNPAPLSLTPPPLAQDLPLYGKLNK